MSFIFLVNFVLYIFIFLATLGLFSSLIVHLVGFFNNSDRLNKIAAFFWIGGIFMGFPTAIIGHQITADYPRREYWEIIFINCPEWMKYGFDFFFAYSLFYIAVVMLKVNLSYKIAVSKNDNSSEEVFNVNVLTLFGGIMTVYAAALVIFYSALQVYG